MQSAAHTPASVPAAAAGRAALVIGGTGRIGRAVVAAVAAGGHDVAVHCHAALPAARELAAALGGRSLAVTADLREEGAVRALVHRVIDHFGRLDAVVVCGRRHVPTPLDDVTAADLRAHFDVNVAGGFVVAQEAGAVMVAQDTGGVIVFVGGAEAGPARPGDVPFLASNAALPGLAHGLQVEFAARSPRVRVSCVEPGDADPAAIAAAVIRLVVPGIGFPSPTASKPTVREDRV
jgi:pteridine reductase